MPDIVTNSHMSGRSFNVQQSCKIFDSTLIVIIASMSPAIIFFSPCPSRPRLPLSLLFLVPLPTSSSLSFYPFPMILPSPRRSPTLPQVPFAHFLLSLPSIYATSISLLSSILPPIPFPLILSLFTL